MFLITIIAHYKSTRLYYISNFKAFKMIFRCSAKLNFFLLYYFFLFQHFREQCIDGSGLPLLTEDHLVNSLGMKLGPALKLRSMLAKKLGGPCPCVACVAQAQQILALQTGAVANPATATAPASNATTSALETVGSCSSRQLNATAGQCVAASIAINNSGTNCASTNNTGSVNKNDSTTMASSNATVPVNNNKTENNGGSSITTNNNNCNIVTAALPPPAYSNCSSSNYSASSKNSASNRDDSGGSSSGSS